MSEFTSYYAVKSTSEDEVQTKLNIAQIKCVIDADKDDSFFLENYRRNGVYRWVVVSAPSRGEDVFELIAGIFDTVVHFFMEEDFATWQLKIKMDGAAITTKFKVGEDTLLSARERIVFTACFDKPFSNFGDLLKPKLACEFLNSVGIPYMETNDQDLVPVHIFENRHSVLASEIID